MAAAPGWARLDTGAKDALTAALARTRIRMTALEPQYVARGGQDGFDIALRRLDAVCHADYMFRAVAALTSGADTAGDLSAREVFLAESVLWHLARRGPEERVILVAHNNHIQKAPVRFDNGPTVLPMGLHLQRALGSDYRAIALTHSDDHVAEMYPSPGHAAGFTVRDTALDPPRPGTVESALTRAGFGDQITMTDLRRPPDDTETGPLLTGIRSQSTTLELSVTDAFDAVLCLPTVTTDDTIGFGGSVDR
ncbi:erythromycin esterase family protein [Nocardia arizonensis]|uniref:erythromycin esterase family protein n=1 Tax=Nocardia arizonensis TaxID=1141647 RepID=UPI0006CF9E4E|nr:erythromycin esterase family protein [Nocardia arizonensis]